MFPFFLFLTKLLRGKSIYFIYTIYKIKQTTTMKTRDEIKELNVRYFSEITKIILFENDDEIKGFIKWTKPELLEFYNYWKQYDDFDDRLTMKSNKYQMRIVVGRLIRNMARQLMFNDGDISRKDMLDYITIKRREKIINELIN